MFFSSSILSDSAKIEINLAIEALDHEMQVEQSVVNPLQQMLDNDVAKHKAKLSKLTLDMDSARARYLLLTFENYDKTIFSRNVFSISTRLLGSCLTCLSLFQRLYHPSVNSINLLLCVILNPEVLTARASCNLNADFCTMSYYKLCSIHSIS
jgi:hypothetical protein